jgi:son of sevenless-like protein
VQQVRSRGQELVTYISAFLSFIADVHVARHVDIDGIRQADATTNDRYSSSVENARQLVRELETVVQAVYDDSSALFMTIQTLHDGDQRSRYGERESSYDLLHRLSLALRSNLAVVKQTFDGLLSIGHEQADLAEADYNGSIDWRLSRLSVIPDNFGGAIHATRSGDVYFEDEDIVDLEIALKPGLKKQKSNADSSYDSNRTFATDIPMLPGRESEVSLDTNDTLVSPTFDGDVYDENDDLDGKKMFTFLAIPNIDTFFLIFYFSAFQAAHW